MSAGICWLRDGSLVTKSCAASPERVRGTWMVLLDCLHVFNGRRYRAARAEAVLDDFGDLVMVAGADGKVVLQ